MLDKIKVNDTHEMEFLGDRFKVGCQTIDFDQAKEVAKWILEKEKVKQFWEDMNPFVLYKLESKSSKEVIYRLFDGGNLYDQYGEWVGINCDSWEEYFQLYDYYIFKGPAIE